MKVTLAEAFEIADATAEEAQRARQARREADAKGSDDEEQTE